MKYPKISVGFTLTSQSDELLGAFPENHLLTIPHVFYNVELDMLGGYILREFTDIFSSLEHSMAHRLVYRFAKPLNEGVSYSLLFLHDFPYEGKIIAYRNFYGIGGVWKLYLNSKDNIVIQHLDFSDPDSTIRFRNFPLDNTFYVHLACLIHGLNNYEHHTGKEIQNTYERISKIAFRAYSL